MEKILIGQEIKQEVQNQGLSVEKFAEKLQMSTSEAEELFEKTSLETDLLLQISKLLKRDFFSLFSNSVNGNAKDETIAILKERGEKCFVSYERIEEDTPWVQAEIDNGQYWETQTMCLIGVGLDNSGSLIVHVDSSEDCCDYWIGIDDIDKNNYADIYDFVVNHPDLTMTKEEAENININ